MRHQKHTSHRLSDFAGQVYALLALLGLVVLFIWPSFVRAMPLTATHRLQNTWARANSVGIYEYRTDLVQTIHPTERLENVGRSSNSKRMVVEGETNRHENLMHMVMSGQTGTSDVIEIKVEAQQAFGRLNVTDEWTALDGTAESSDLFAPGGDPLGFLVAAENVREEANVKTEALLGLLDDELDTLVSNPTLLRTESVTRYTFDVNGVKYAEFMRDQLHEELRRKGELPAGINLGLAEQYVETKAQGEIWVNEAGLPVRQIMHLEFPAENGAVNRVSADITTDFTNWGATTSELSSLLPRLIDNPSLLISNPASLLPSPYTLINPQAFTFATAQKVAVNLGLMLLISALVLLLVRHRDSRKLYAAFSMAIIISMVFSPLMRLQPVHAFNERQITRQAEQQVELSPQEEQEALVDEVSGRNFNPHVKPRTQSSNNFSRSGPEERQKELLQASSDTDSCASDTDGDGDGLSDNVECYELGTWIDDIDTDNDFISDYAEVTGFQDDNGLWWYLDPRNPDSNGDGLIDGIECPELSDVTYDENDNLTLESVTYSDCADSDGDEVPDLFDYDNDGDGVPDNVDTSPFDYIGDLSSGLSNDELNLTLDGIHTDTNSVLVEFQVRPTNADHLWHANQVLDWPSTDTEGQVTRKAGVSTDDTWLNYNSEIYSGDASAAHGDLRLTPLLEIEISYSDSNPSAGLPITGTLQNNSSDIPDYSNIEWVDTDTLDQYGISVNYTQSGDTLLLYVPLYVLDDQVGDTPVAFMAQMVYQPTDNWGDVQKVRLLWLVNALTDYCDTSVMPDQFTSEDGDTISQNDEKAYDLWCAYDQYEDDNNNFINVWQTESTIIKTYYDPFYVSGMSVQEDYGTKMAMIAQPNSTGVEGYLWNLADQLQSSWLDGQAYDGGRFDVFDLDDAYSSYVNNENLYIRELTLPNQLALADVATTYNREVLNTVFTSPEGNQAATILYASETDFRQATMTDEDTTISDNHVIFDFSSTQREVEGSLHWNPFVYQDEEWTHYSDLQTYLDGPLQTKLTTSLTNEALSAIVNGDTINDVPTARKGAIQLAQSYYLSAYVGTHSLLELDGTASSDETVSDLTLDNNVLTSLLQRLLAEMQSYYERLGLTISLESDITGASVWQNLATSSSTLLLAIGDEASGTYSLAVQELNNYYKTADLDPNIFGQSAITATGLSEEECNLSRKSCSLYYAIEFGTKTKNSISKIIKLVKSIKAHNLNKFRKTTTSKMGIKMEKSTALMLSIALAAGPFLFSWMTGELSANSLGFTQALAEVYAQIVTEVLVYALSLNPFMALAFLIIALIDILIWVVCEISNAAGEDIDYEGAGFSLCAGIMGAITQALSYVLFDQTPLVNLTKKNRLDFAINRMTLVNESLGFAAGNQIQIGGVITSSLYFNTPTTLGWTYWHQFSDTNLKKSNFDYEFQAEQNKVSVSNTDWVIPDARSSSNDGEIASDKRFYQTFERSNDFTLTDIGINSPLEIYLSEGLSIKTQECWQGFTVIVCYLRNTNRSNHNDLSQSFLFDVFPATFSEFVQMALVQDNSYRIAWDEQFPIQWDADGDGLISQHKGGPDPNDNNPDVDADGLSDSWEYHNGYEMTEADGDGDGLTDYWELFYNTNPRRADSDGDGLVDGAEVFHPNKSYPYENNALTDDDATFSGGWTIVYDYDNSGNPLETLIQANPNDVDSDDDTILDQAEYIYGYNPTVPNALNVLSLNSSVDTTLVKPADTINYDAEISNELDNRYASGLLQSEFPIDVVQETQVMDTLPPGESTSMSGAVTAPTVQASQNMSLTVRAGAVVEDLSSDRTLWLRFNESAGSTTFADDSLNGHDATCANTATCPTANESYLDFGTNDTLVLDEESLDDDGSYSFGFWFYPHSSLSYHVDTIVDKDSHFTAGIYSQDNSKYLFIQLEDQICDDEFKRAFIVSEEIEFAPSRWQHIMVTVSDYTASFYINGVNVPLHPQWGGISNDDEECQPSSHFKIYPLQEGGALDDVEFYNRVLSANEVRSLAQEPILDLDMVQLSDESSSNTPLTCVGDCPTLDQAERYFNQISALDLSGEQLALDNGEFTFALWVKPEQRNSPFHENMIEGAFEFRELNQVPGDSDSINDDWMGIFGNELAYDETGNDYIYETLRVAYPSLLVNENGYLLARFGYHDDNSQHCQFVTSTPVVTLDEWQHLTLSFDGNQYTIYRDGKEVAEGGDGCAGKIPATQLDSSTAKQLYVGTQSSHAYFYFDSFELLEYENTGTYNFYLAGTKFWDKNANNSNLNLLWQPNKRRLVHEVDGKNFKFYVESSGAKRMKRERTIRATRARHEERDLHTTSDNQDKIRITWGIANDLYQGGLSDFKLYNYSLSDEAVADLYNTTYYALNMPFDEPPGKDTFSDLSGNGFQASCDNSNNSCPDSGIPGRDNQALRFDGDVVHDEDRDTTPDYLTLPTADSLGLTDASFTAMAWVKLDDLSGNNTILGTGTPSLNEGLHLTIRNSKPYFGFFANDTASTTVLETDKWYHLAWVYDKDAQTQTIYLDGTQDVVGTNKSAFQGTDPVWVGRWDYTQSLYFDGMIDELFILRSALSQAQVQELMAQTPIFNLHLDESINTSTFVDESSLANDMTCASENSCPKAGDKGQMREAAVFDGNDQLQVNLSGDEWALDTFTIGGWVKPTQTKNQWMYLFRKENDSDVTQDNNFRLSFERNTLQPILVLKESCDSSWKLLLSHTGVNENQWNHVMATYDGAEATIYVNGLESASRTLNGICAEGTNQLLTIGENLEGNLDEMTIHRAALSALEVAALYDYQAAWYDVTEEHLITVDAVGPTVELGVSTSHLAADPDVVLSIAAVDDVSSVASVEYRINGGAWQAATQDNEAWLFTFTPSNGEGSYTIEARATDAVGNVGTTSSVTFTVDNSAPTVTLSSNNYDLERQQLTLNGTIADIGGGGVLTGSVEIDVLDVAGVSVSGVKVATVSLDDDSWTLDYPFTQPPYGDYSVQAIGSDALGNRTESTTLASVSLDAYPPFSDVGMTSNVISDTVGASITGVLNTQPVPGEQRAAHFHFEEDSLASGQAVDSSGNFYHATCDVGADKCPIAGESGKHFDRLSAKHGQAFTFDGANDYLTFDTDLDPSTQDFTAMVWFKHVSSSGNNPILAQSNGSGMGRIWLGMTGDNRLYTYLGGSLFKAVTPVDDQNWHHIAVSYDQEEQLLSLYLDGVLETSATKTMEASDGAMQIGSNKGFSHFFPGSLDEVLLYNRALSAGELYDIANPLDTQVDNLKIRYRHASGSVWQGLNPDELALYLPFDGNDFSDMSVYDHQLDCTTCPTTEQTGKEGYGLLFDATDDYLELDHILDPSTTSFSAATWVKVGEYNSSRHVLQQVNGTGLGRTWLGITGNKQPYTWLGGSELTGSTTIGDEAWHHIAVTYDQGEQQLSLYVDGVLENSTTRSMEASDGAMLIGSDKHISKFFPGSLDELVIYQRALSADEVNVLATTSPWQTVSLDNSANTFTTWSHSVPTELTDGPYKLDLWATDALGNVSNMLNAWTGQIDTHAPTVTFTYTDNGDGTAQVSCDASDVNLTEEGWICPVSPVISQTQQANWYQQLFGDYEQLLRLVTAEETVSTSAGDSMTACDSYGHCTTASNNGTTTTSNRAQIYRKVVMASNSPSSLRGGESIINNFNLTLSVEGTPLKAGDTVDWLEVPTLLAEWEAEGDVASVQIEWQVYQSDGSVTVVQSDTLPVSQTSNSYQAEEAQELRIQLIAILTDGREVEESIEPIYIDYGTTPVYVDLDLSANNQLEAQYTGWLENSCNLIGQDQRHTNQASRLSTLDDTQQFYSSWDENGLRLNWTGGDWRHDGDLFIYLDSKEGGTVAAYNPYPATEDNVLIFQPVDQAENQGMTADYMVWVRETTITETVTITDEDDGTTEIITRTVPRGASLMAWDSENEQWAEIEAEWGYRFDHNSRRTDIYLPFELLDITDPTSQGLSLVALASEENRLKLWSTMPHRNNVNSEKVIGRAGQANAEGFMLLSQYTWSNLAPDSCPSGNLTDVADASRSINVENVYFNGADLHASITSDPAGLSYSLFNNHLIDGHTQRLAGLCDGLPEMGEDDDSSLLSFSTPEGEAYADLVSQFLCERHRNNPALKNSRQIMGQFLSTDYALITHRQEINYSLTIANHGKQTANDITAFVSTEGALRLPEGTPQGDGYIYVAEIDSLAPGEKEIITFLGVIDIDLNGLKHAKVSIQIYDETGDEYHPSEQLALEHHIDKDKPTYVELQSPTMVVGVGEQTFSGFVNDQSDVPTIRLKLNQEEINCSDSTPAEAQWSCPVTISGVDGDLISTQIKARDKYDFESDFFDGPTLVVDTTSPTLTLSAETTNTFSGTLVAATQSLFSGEIADNRLVERVEVCEGDGCEAASVTLDQSTLPQTSYTYSDIPETSITLDNNNTCRDGSPLVRTFNVTDTFTIADLDVGLTLAHHFRNDIEVTLQSPSGTESRLIQKASGNANFDILFDDSALRGIARDYDLTEHHIGSPHYENVRQPYPDDLYRFHGEPAAGTWTLSICDKHAHHDDGEYLRSELFFTAQVLPEETRATWQYKLDLPSDVESLNKSLTIYAYDSVGNRSEAVELDFTVDNRAPELAISTQSIERAEIESLLTLQGTISDANDTSARLIIRRPNNQLSGARIEVTDGEWHYSDTRQFTREGTYCLWIEAKDRIGNKTVLAPLALQAIEPQEVYLPLMSSSPVIVTPDNNIGPYKQYLPMIATGESAPTLPPSAINTLMLRFVEGSVCR